MSRSAIPVAGTRFGEWTSLGEFIPAQYGQKCGPKILCRCSCEAATEKYIRLSVLRSGATISCGCVKRKSAVKSKKQIKLQAIQASEINAGDARDLVIETSRWLLSAYLGEKMAERFEVGVEKHWHDNQYWVEAEKRVLIDIIQELAA